MRATKLLFVWHRWLGLVSGLLLLVVGLSGSALVFHDEIDQWLFPHLHAVEPRGERASLDEIYETVRAAHPEAWDLRYRRLRPDDPGRSLQMSLHLPRSGGSEWCYLYVDPYDGTILGIQGADTRRGFADNPVDWLLWLHFSLLGGKLGQLVVGLLSIAFVGSLSTGLFVYRRKVLSALCFRVPIRFGSWRSAASSLHRVVGVWAVLLNLLLAVTGFWMMRYVFDPGFYAPVTQDTRPAPALTYSLDSMLVQVEREVPSFEPHWTSPIRADGSPIVLGGAVEGQSSIFSADSRVRYDPRSGEILDTDLLPDRSWTGKLASSVNQLHFGSYGGWPVKSIYVIGGLTPPLLSITGFLLYVARRRSRSRGRRRQGLGARNSPPPHVSGG